MSVLVGKTKKSQVKYDREARRAISALYGGVDAKAFELIEAAEYSEIVAVPELCAAISLPTITLVGFSCTFGDDGEREIDIGRYGFFEKKTKAKTEALLAGLKALGKEVHLVIFIDDFEFRRVWNWFRPQEELTEECEFQIELAQEEGKIPAGSEVGLWSAVEPQARSLGCASYEEALTWAAAPAQSRAIDEIARMRQTYPRNRDIKLSELRASSGTGLAVYSLAGETLELLYPDSIFIHAADHRRDHMLGYRRKQPLPIIHPWR